MCDEKNRTQQQDLSGVGSIHSTDVYFIRIL